MRPVEDMAVRFDRVSKSIGETDGVVWDYVAVARDVSAVAGVGGH